jgi:hypothetical protein
MAVEATPYLNINLPVPNTERGSWATVLNSALISYDKYIFRGIHHTLGLDIIDGDNLGYFEEIATGSPLLFTIGTGRIIVRIGSGSDLQGTITLSGTAYAPYTDTTSSVSEDITIDGTGDYISRYMYTGEVTLSYLDLTINYDVWSLKYWNNYDKNFSINRVAVEGRSASSSATVDVAIKKIDTITGKLLVTTLYTLSITSPTANTVSWSKDKTLLTSTFDTQYEGILLTANVSDASHWNMLRLQMEIVER